MLAALYCALAKYCSALRTYFCARRWGSRVQPEIKNSEPTTTISEIVPIFLALALLIIGDPESRPFCSQGELLSARFRSAVARRNRGVVAVVIFFFRL